MPTQPLGTPFVVTYDLDAGSKRSHFSRVKRPTSGSKHQDSFELEQLHDATRSSQQEQNTSISQNNTSDTNTFERRSLAQYQAPVLFNLDDSSDEENPFATILEVNKEKEKTILKQKESSEPNKTEDFATTGTQVPITQKPPSNKNSTIRSLSKLKFVHQSYGDNKDHKPIRESAELRPNRWNQATNLSFKRNKIAQSPKDASITIKRRKSRRQYIPPSSNDYPNGTIMKTNLSDVLHRATLLSQRSISTSALSTASSHHHFPQFKGTSLDNITDTIQEFQCEKPQNDIFSPTSRKKEFLSSRKSQANKNSIDHIVGRIPGDLGRHIQKATRGATRDLTFLRSHEQSLLHQQQIELFGNDNRTDLVKDRNFVNIKLLELIPYKNYMLYRAQIHITISNEITESKRNSSIPSDIDDGSEFLVCFQIAIAEQMKFASNAVVKVYEPFHFVPSINHMDSSRKWMMVGTNLCEIIEV